jgi:hypothetical protein
VHGLDDSFLLAGHADVKKRPRGITVT